MKWSTILLLITLLFIVKSDLNKEQLSKYSIYDFINYLKLIGLWNFIYDVKIIFGDFTAIDTCETFTFFNPHCTRVVKEFMKDKPKINYEDLKPFINHDGSNPIGKPYTDHTGAQATPHFPDKLDFKDYLMTKYKDSLLKNYSLEEIEKNINKIIEKAPTLKE